MAQTSFSSKHIDKFIEVMVIYNIDYDDLSDKLTIS